MDARILIGIITLVLLSGCLNSFNEGITLVTKSNPVSGDNTANKSAGLPGGSIVSTSQPVSGKVSPVPVDLCGDYYKGITFDGFCYTDFIHYGTEAQNGAYVYTDYGSNVERTVHYPTSLQLVYSPNLSVFEIHSDINIALENKGGTAKTVHLDQFGLIAGGYYLIDFNETYTIDSNEIIEITIPINLTNLPRGSPVPNGIISFCDNDACHALPRIVLYWDYDPFSNEDITVGYCGGRYFGEDQGICNRDTLFPTFDRFSCQTDLDCEKWGDNINCFEYACLYTGIIGPRNRPYRTGILPLYVTDYDQNYTSMKEIINDRLDLIVPSMESWFDDEKNYWNVDNNFSLDYFKVNDENGCRMTYAEFEAIHPVWGQMLEDELREIESQCVANPNYDILIISVQKDNEYFPNYHEAGISYGTIIALSLGPRTILHELLHGFGENDLYNYEDYQWGNCYLYNTLTGNDWDDTIPHPHLCKFEAMQLGWFPKWPN